MRVFFNIVKTLLIFFAVWLVVTIILLTFIDVDSEIGGWTSFAVLAIPIICGVLFTQGIGRSRQRKKASILKSAQEDEQARLKEQRAITDQVEKHRVALLRNVRRAVRKNDYGRVVEDQSSDKIVEFLDSIDRPKVISTTDAIAITQQKILEIQATQKSSSFNVQQIPADPLEFERWVARGLENYGWVAEVTSGSSDQGIDVIAEKNGVKVGLQCKLYSSAVGNKAVQEAISGKYYYGLDRVGVITNSEYTRSASDLALSSGVALLTNDDLSNPDAKLL